jgi:hypothetical protein
MLSPVIYESVRAGIAQGIEGPLS